MDARVTEDQNTFLSGAFRGLASSLAELVSMYKELLALIAKEKEFLLTGNPEELTNNNQTKESLLKKIAGVEGLRIGFAASIARGLNMSHSTPRILEIADALKSQRNLSFTNEEAQLRNYYIILSELLEQVIERNKDNESLAISALKIVGGAIENIKDTLGGKKTYQKKGKYKQGPEQSGNFVSKEA